MFTGLLEKIGSFRAQKREAAIMGYSQLVRHIAAKKPIDPERASEILDAAGKSEADLTADVKHVESRAADAALVASFEATLAELRSASRELDAENMAYSKRREEHYATENRLNSTIAKARNTLDAIEKAKSRLRDGAAEELQHEKNEFGKQRANQSRFVELLRTEEQDVRARLATAQQFLGKMKGQGLLGTKDADETRSDIAKLQGELSNVGTRLTQAIATQSQLDADYDRVRDQMLVA